MNINFFFIHFSISLCHVGLFSFSLISFRREIISQIEFSFASPNSINFLSPNIVENNFVDLDGNANISFNKLEINTTKLTSLEKSATLYIYNLTFSDPRVLRDGGVCPSSICTENSYSGGLFSFNVTNFTIYSAEETPVDAPASGPSGGGGAILKTSFTLNKDLIKVLLKQGETKREVIEIKNSLKIVIKRFNKIILPIISCFN